MKTSLPFRRSRLLLVVPAALLLVAAAAPRGARADEETQPTPQASPSPSPSPTPLPTTIDMLIQPKLAGGQFSGAQGLYRSERVKVGGYMDFRYQTRGIDDGFEIRESADQEHPDETDITNFKRSGFTAPRLITGIAAAITDHLVFNSEIEFEFGGVEVEVEQAYVEYRFNRSFNVRTGVFTPPLGRFNIFHDANLQDIDARPLSSTFVIPSTYKDAGAGILGEFPVGSAGRLTYEAYVVNGLRSDEGGEFAREAGIFESKGNNRFFDNNPQKSLVGRLMFSPTLALELGASGYRGKHDNTGLYNLSIWALDWKYNHKGLQVLGQYARTAVQRPPESEQELAARDFLLNLPKGDYSNTFDFLDQVVNVPLFDTTSRSSDGFYAEARYRFFPQWLRNAAGGDASIAPVYRYDRVNFDRTFPDFSFPLNMARHSFGISIRPTEAATFNFVVHKDRTPDVFLRLEDGRPFPPYFTNAGVWSFSFGAGFAF